VPRERRVGFSNITLWALAVLFAFPLQILVLVGVQLGNDVRATLPSTYSGRYACTNFVHGSTPFRCDFERLVHNAVEAAVILDFFTFGLALVATILATALFLIAVRAIHRRSLEWARDR
jgi:hypothetical protein